MKRDATRPRDVRNRTLTGGDSADRPSCSCHWRETSSCSAVCSGARRWYCCAERILVGERDRWRNRGGEMVEKNRVCHAAVSCVSRAADRSSSRPLAAAATGAAIYGAIVCQFLRSNGPSCTSASRQARWLTSREAGPRYTLPSHFPRRSRRACTSSSRRVSRRSSQASHGTPRDLRLHPPP